MKNWKLEDSIYVCAHTFNTTCIYFIERRTIFYFFIMFLYIFQRTK